MAAVGGVVGCSWHLHVSKSSSRLIIKDCPPYLLMQYIMVIPGYIVTSGGTFRGKCQAQQIAGIACVVLALVDGVWGGRR